MNNSQTTEKIETLKNELPGILQEGLSSGNSDLTRDRLTRWVDRTSKTLDTLISPSEGKKLKDARPGVFTMGDIWGNIEDEVKSYESHLTALLEEILNNPEFVIASTEKDGLESIPAPSNLAKIEKICRRFKIVARQLRNRYQGRDTLEINDEYDVQDLFHALLKLEFDDVRAEEVTPSYAGGSSRTDFLLKNERVVVETKKTRQGLSDNEIGKELIIDIERYQTHSDCKLLICFIYDPEGKIGNPQGLINDLEGRPHGLDLRVIIEPI